MTAALAALAPFTTRAGSIVHANRPLRLVIPFTAGGGCDVMARLVSEQLTLKLGQPIIVENRPGASGRVAAATVALSTSDSNMLLVGSATLAGNVAVNGPGHGINVVEDFEFVGKIGGIDLMLVTSSKLQIKDLRGLVSLMKSQPDTVEYGSPGVGSMSHLASELLKLASKTSATHIPYKGESAALSDLISGNLTFQFCSPHICLPWVADGTLKALGIASSSRSPLMPTVPTIAQAGLPGVEVGTWWYLAAPKGTPSAVSAKLNSGLNKVLADERFLRRLAASGVHVQPRTTPEVVREELHAELVHWRLIAKAAGITA